MSGELAELCAETSIWPVRFSIRSKTGYTLWGPINDEQDVFLAAGGKMLTYPSLEEMATHLPEQEGHSFTGRDSFQRFLGDVRRALSQPVNSEYEVHGNDFDFIARILAEPAVVPRRFGSMIVECLDATYDFAIQLDDSTMCEALRSRQHPLGQLYYSLWGEGRLSDADLHPVREAFDALMAWIDERMIFVKA